MVSMKKDAVREHRIEAGISAGDIDMYSEDAVWSRFSHDKVDIGEVLMETIRILHRSLPLSRRLRTLSVGSGSEPQFNILESAFTGGVYLLDSDPVPLRAVARRLKWQDVSHVTTIERDYTKVLADPGEASLFRIDALGGKRVDLVTLHHSLYYCGAETWRELFEGLYGELLARRGAIHAVMMASTATGSETTTRLYDHFAGKFFGCRNDQDLRAFGIDLEKSGALSGARFWRRRHRVEFFIDDFRRFMSVVWMILLYPDVHDYTYDQKREITEHVYDRFWEGRDPLVQMQDHLVIYKQL